MDTKSDEDLINQYLATGDRSLVEGLFLRYRSLVFGVSMKFLGNRSDSKDATMNVFEKILRFQSDQEIRDFPNWLFTLTKNSCLDIKYRRQKDAATTKDFENFKKSDELVVENQEAGRLLNEEKEELDAFDLKEALQQLGPDQRNCIELFFFKKMRYKAIEQETGIPEKQVKSLLQNGKRKLKRILLQQKIHNRRKRE